MTTVEVLYRYAGHPSEAAMMALGNAREVYGIRRIQLDAAAKTVRIEYDATRLSRVVVAQLLRRGGISITGEILLIPALPPAPGVVLAAASGASSAPTSDPVKPSVTSTAAPGSAAQPASSAPALAK